MPRTVPPVHKLHVLPRLDWDLHLRQSERTHGPKKHRLWPPQSRSVLFRTCHNFRASDTTFIESKWGVAIVLGNTADTILFSSFRTWSSTKGKMWQSGVWIEFSAPFFGCVCSSWRWPSRSARTFRMLSCCPACPVETSTSGGRRCSSCRWTTPIILGVDVNFFPIQAFDYLQRRRL